jgi:hypothetical protein
VRYLQGKTFSSAFSDALLYSARANSRDKLPLSLNEKSERAWQLSIYNERQKCYSLQDIADASGVSKSTANNMAGVLRENRPENARELTWQHVKVARRGEPLDYSDELEEQRAREWANKMRSEWGDQPETQPERWIAANEMAYPQVMEPLLNAAAERDDDDIDDETSCGDF